MAIRTIRLDGDDVLRKTSKTVKENSPKIQELIDDMFDTMYNYDGVGLAAVQVGVLRRIFIVDIGEGQYTFINPEIIEVKDEQTGYEGCLSLPGMQGIVTRPNYVKIKALNREFDEFEVEANELFARAIMHEYEHLDGKMFKDKVKGKLIKAEDVPEGE